MAQNPILLSRARSAVMARDFSLAARLYRQLLRDDRNNLQLMNQLGELYMKSGRDDQALPVFKRIAELDKENCAPLITIGGIYRRLKKYEESVAALEDALVLDGDNPQISYNLGFTYKLMGDFDNAVSCFEDAIEMNPEDVLAYNHLGSIYEARGEHEKAVQTYQRGLNIDANHPVLLLNIAKSYEALGEYEKACAAYSGALRSRPLWTEAIDDYARLLISTHRSNDAYSLVARAISVNPDDKSLKDALERIKPYIKSDIEYSAAKEKTAGKKSIPSLFGPLERVDDSEFNSGGAEVFLGDDKDFDLEDGSESGSSVSDNPKPAEQNSLVPVDIDTMKMDDDLAGTSLDSILHSGLDENAAGSGRGLEGLALDDDSPIDTDEIPADTDDIFTDDSTFRFETDSPVESTLELEDGAEKTFQSDFPSLEETAINIENGKSDESGSEENAGELEEIDESGKPDDAIPFLDDAEKENSDKDVSDSDELALFLKLKELLSYLPEAEKNDFLSSGMRIKLDYIISRLSGGKGLFAAAASMIEKGEVQPCSPSVSDDEDERNLFAEGIAVLKSLASEVSDKSLGAAMEKQLDKIL